MTGAAGIWVYAVTGEIDAGWLAQLTGVGGGRPDVISAAGLFAVTESVPLDQFGAAALRRNLEDLDWLEGVARAHHSVIDGLAGNTQVVPLRLATVYSESGGVEEMLTRQAPKLAAVLNRTVGHREWGVKAYAASADAGRAAERSGHAASAPGSGAEYLRRRRDQLTAQRQRRHDALASAEELHASLSRLAADARLHPPQSPQLAGSTAEMVLNAAYLLPDQGAVSFGEAVRDLSGRLPLRLELTGPWPPYSFAAAAVEEP